MDLKRIIGGLLAALAGIGSFLVFEASSQQASSIRLFEPEALMRDPRQPDDPHDVSTPVMKVALAHSWILQPDESSWPLTAWMIDRLKLRLGASGSFRHVNYTDPTADELVPLMRVWGAEETRLSEHFRVRDFVASDGAAFARISFDLVDALEGVSRELGQRIYVSSGYRHPGLNFRADIGGARESLHIAGLAADVWSDAATPLEVARAAVDALGCEIGLGLGANFLHIDLRGRQASWATEEAPMDEVEFDLWVLDQCERLAGRSAHVEKESNCRRLSGLSMADAYRREMQALAHVQRRRGEEAAIVLDLRPHVPGRDSTFTYAIGADALDAPLVRALKLEPLIQRAGSFSSFVYVVIGADGSHEVGIMHYGAESPHVSAAPDDGCSEIASLPSLRTENPSPGPF